MTPIFSKMQVRLFQFGAAALGGLAAIGAGLAQRSADNVNRRVGNTDGDISSLQSRLSDLENDQENIQRNLNNAQTAANNAVTPAQLNSISLAANSAQRTADRLCDGVSNFIRRVNKTCKRFFSQCTVESLFLTWTWIC